MPATNAKTVSSIALAVAAAATVVSTTATTFAAAETTVSYTYVGCANDPNNNLLATGYPSNPAAVQNYVEIQDILPDFRTSVEFCLEQCAAKGTLFAAITDNKHCTCGVLFNEDASPAADPNSCVPAVCPKPMINEEMSNDQLPCGADKIAAVYKINPSKCERDNSYYQYKKQCYRFEGNTNLASNWTSAKALCESEGARLVTIDSHEENNFVLSLPNYINTANNGADFWAGGRYYGPQNGFEWVNGRLPTFFDWADGEPNTGVNNENCLDVASATATSVGGTWSARSCRAKKRFVCKKYFNASGDDSIIPQVQPRVQAVSVGAATACVSPDHVSLQFTNDLELRYTFDSSTIDTTANTAADSSNYGRNATVKFLNGNAPKYTFEKNLITMGDSLVFDGNTTIEAPTGWAFRSSNTISVTAWVKPSRVSYNDRLAQMIVTKGLDNEDHGGFGVLSWALAVVNNSQYCFMVADKAACTRTGSSEQFFRFDAWTFVAGVYDGRTISVYVNGTQAASINGERVPVTNNVSTAVVIGGASGFASGILGYVSFIGVLDDVRVYSAALGVGDLEYLETCALSPFVTNRIEAYANTDIFLVILGHSLYTTQRVGLSKNGCAKGTPFDLPTRNPIFMKGYMSSTRLTVQFPATQITSGDYDLCYATTDSPDAYEGGLNITIRVVELTSFDSGKKKLEINTDSQDGDNFAATVALNGVNLHNGSVVVLSPFQACNYRLGNAIAFVTAASADGTTANMVVRHASIQTEYFYLCWAGSYEDAQTLNRVVATGLAIELVGSRYTTKAVAYNDGTSAVTPTAIRTGFALDNGNYFMDCNSLDDPNERYYLKVDMGAFTDYIIPAENYTACDVLLGAYWSNPNSGDSTLYLASYYSPIDPLSPYYDGQYTTRIPAGGFGSLGGSASSYPIDGRRQLTQWGTSMGYSAGGCCHSTTHQERSWNQPYKITGILYDPSKLAYFQVDEVPRVVFVGEIVSIRVKVVSIDDRALTLKGGCVFKLTQGVGGDNATSTEVISERCDYTFRTTLRATTETFYVEGALQNTRTTYQIYNSNNSTFTVVTAKLPYDSEILHSGQNITEMLAFSAAGGLESVMYTSFLHSSVMNMFEPSDSLLSPQEEQPMVAHDVFDRKDYEWVWKKITTVDDLFGDTVPKGNGVQYFAFAFYTTVMQNVAFHGGCRAFRRQFANTQEADCAMFVGGKQLITEELRVSAGWHQVIIKIVNGKPLSETQGLWLAMDGNGLAFGVDKPLGAPEGSTLLYEGSMVEEYMVHGTNPFIANSFDDNNLGQNEAYARPAQDGEWWPFDTPVDGVPIVAPPTLRRYQLAIYYFGTGLYATSTGVVTFTIPKAMGAVRMYQNGVRVANFAADLNGPDRVIQLLVREGWSQLLFKVSAVSENSWNFKLVAYHIVGTVLFSQPAMPEILPTGTVDFATRPLGEVLTLVTKADGAYALPYDTTSTTDPAAVDPEYTQVNASRAVAAGDAETVEGVSFVWNSFNARDASTGSFGESRNDGGGYNRYYAFALYASNFADVINATVNHEEGVAVWFDGSYIAGSKSNGGNGSALHIHLTNVSQGWHTVHVRVQAVNSLRFINMTSASHDSATSTCAKNQLNLCGKNFDICPLQKGRVDIGIPLGDGAASWAAIGDSDSSWMYVGKASSDNSVCKTVKGDDSFRSAPASTKFYAACCGVAKPAYFSFAITAFPSRALVGWAPAIPTAKVLPPTVTSAQNGLNLTVTLSHNDSTAELFYTTNRALYPNVKYTGPFNILLGGFVRTIARVNGVDSAVYETFVRVLSNMTVSRTQCSRGPHCYVQVSLPSEPAALFANQLVVVVDTSSADGLAELEKVMASSVYVQNANPATAMFVGFIAIDNNNVVKIPQAFTTRTKLTQMTVVIFDAGAAYRDTKGYAIPTTIAVAPFALTSTNLYRNVEYAPVSVTGSFVGGDSIIFPQLFVNDAEWSAMHANQTVCSQEACEAIGTYELAATRRIHFQGVETIFVNTTDAHATPLASITCACILSSGGLLLGRSEYRNYISAGLVTFPAFPVTDLPATDATKNTEIYTYGPRTVSAFHTNVSAGALTAGLNNRIFVSGNFPSGNTADYSASFDCAAGVAVTTIPFNCSTGATAPTASISAITDNGRTMELHVHGPQHGRNMAGLWTLRVERNGASVPTNVPLNYAKNFFVGVLPPNPTVTHAAGDCAFDTTKCVTGALITFVGTNFNDADINLNKVELYDTTTGALSNAAGCVVVGATDTTLTCLLVIISTSALSTALEVVIRVEAIPAPRQSDEVYASAYLNTHNSLIFGGPAGQQGWSGSVIPPSPTLPPSPTNTPKPDNGGDSNNNNGESIKSTGVIAAIACGAVLLIAIFGGVFVVTKYDLIPKKRTTHELDEAGVSLNTAQEPV